MWHWDILCICWSHITNARDKIATSGNNNIAFKIKDTFHITSFRLRLQEVMWLA